MVDCGANLEKISCPQCGAQLAFDWWEEAVSQHYDEGFRTLTVTVPCCGVETSLNALVYDWPMRFARFRIEARHPNRARLTGEELAALTDALGHPLRQVLTHI
ncbi:hypothetical protein [Streptomyces sp. NPDC018045]|uniref:hypothetical protein n=1 Tax=Streptomyces sp. NPDC018045 TaxID=3365037 RepID=UPI0037A75546